MTVRIIPCLSKNTFQYSCDGGDELIECPVSFGTPVALKSSAEIIRSDAFSEFLDNHVTADPGARLVHVEFTGCQLCSEDQSVTSASANVTVQSTTGPATGSSTGSDKVTFPVIMQPRMSGVLVVLRCQLEGTETRRESVVFVSQPTNHGTAIPATTHIPCGTIKDDDYLVGPQIKAIEEVCSISIRMANLSYLTKHNNPHGGVALEPCSNGSRCDLYLYRKTVRVADIETYSQRAKQMTLKDNFKVSLHSLSEAWTATTDAKSLSALCLFYEMRYHSLMPMYRPPIDEMTTKWSVVKDLNPNGHGYNILLKVYLPAIVEEVPSNISGTMQQGHVVVGDASGIVTFLLGNAQCKYEQLKEIGTPVALRNCNIFMDGGHIKLRVSRTGSIFVGASAIKLVGHDFDFEPNPTYDCSLQEYEQVDIRDAVPPRPRTGPNGPKGNIRRPRGNRRGNLRVKATAL